MNQPSELFSNIIETVIIVPNFNGLEHLSECLASLFNQSYRKSKIILVDDCSTDNSINFVKNNFSNVDVLALGKNQGFAKAVNQGIKYSLQKYQPKYLAIINNDTKASKDWLKNSTIAIESEKNIIAVASNMLFYDHPEIINSHGVKFSFGGCGLDINFSRNISEIKKYPKYVLASCWGATLVKSEVFNSIGLLDESFYAYFEDLDWGYRANLLGYKIIFEPKAIVYHKAEAFWRKHLFKKNYLSRRNSIYLIVKNYELKNITKILPSILFNYLVVYPIGYLFNSRVEKGRLVRLFNQKLLTWQRLLLFFIPLISLLWNVKKLPQTLKLRKGIQTIRKASDEKIFKLSSNV